MRASRESKVKSPRANGRVRTWIKNHKVITGIILAILLGLIVLFVVMQVKSSDKSTSDDSDLVSIVKKDLVQSVTLSGTVESSAAYSVSSKLSGVEVRQVNVSVGDVVRAGDIIAVLDDTELSENADTASRSLSSAKRQSEQEIESARLSLDNAKEEKKIQKRRARRDAKSAAAEYNKAAKELSSLKDKLAIAKSERRKAKSKVSQTKSAAASAHRTIDAYKKEIDDHADRIKELEKEIVSPVPEEDVPALRKELAREWDEKYEAEVKLKTYQESAAVAPLLKAEAKAEADYEAAKKSVSSLKKQVAEAKETASTLKEASKKARETQEDVNHSTSNTVKEQKNALKNAYSNAKGNLDTPGAEVRKAQRELDSSVVVAKTDGIVTSVNVRPGDIYQGDAIAVIQDDSSYRVSATADQYDISSLAVDQDVKISINAADMTDTPGTLIYVGSAPMVSEDGSVGTSGSSESSGSMGGSDAVYRVEALIEEPDDRMRIGMAAKVLVTVWEKENCLAVPDEAIQTDENGNNYITVQDDDGKQRDIQVRYGMKTDYYSEIIGKGLKEGLKVVVPSFEEEDGAETEE